LVRKRKNLMSETLNGIF